MYYSRFYCVGLDWNFSRKMLFANNQNPIKIYFKKFYSWLIKDRIFLYLKTLDSSNVSKLTHNFTTSSWEFSFILYSLSSFFYILIFVYYVIKDQWTFTEMLFIIMIYAEFIFEYEFFLFDIPKTFIISLFI